MRLAFFTKGVEWKQGQTDTGKTPCELELCGHKPRNSQELGERPGKALP